MAMVGAALGEHLPIGDVEGCEQRRRAVPDIVMRDALDRTEVHTGCVRSSA